MGLDQYIVKVSWLGGLVILLWWLELDFASVESCAMPSSVFWGGAWWAAVHGVVKSRTRLSDFTFTFHFHALETEVATHSNVLAWRIPGTGEPGRLQTMGL